MPSPVLLSHTFVALICALLHQVDEPANHLPQIQMHTRRSLQVVELIHQAVVHHV